MANNRKMTRGRKYKFVPKVTREKTLFGNVVHVDPICKEKLYMFKDSNGNIWSTTYR
jgi:hypothetical protein